MAVSDAMRRKLVRLARERCCLHRLTWLHRPEGPKWETLHVHHVVFESLGGSDDEDNLIPLCPACHELLHDERRKDGVFGVWMPDAKLRDVWDNWKKLPQLIGTERRISPGDSRRGSWPSFMPMSSEVDRVMVPTTLRTYALDVSFEAYADENYKDFRCWVARELFESIKCHDKWFPFTLPNTSWDSVHLSSDPMVWVVNEWYQYTVGDIMASHRKPITLEAPARFVFNTGDQLRESARLSRTL